MSKEEMNDDLLDELLSDLKDDSEVEEKHEKRKMRNKIEKAKDELELAIDYYSFMQNETWKKIISVFDKAIEHAKEVEKQKRQRNLFKARARRWMNVSEEDFEASVKRMREEFELAKKIEMDEAI